MFITDTVFSQWILFAVNGSIYGIPAWLIKGVVIDRRNWDKTPNEKVSLETTIVVDDIFFYAKHVSVNFSRELHTSANLDKTILSYFIISNNNLWQVSPSAAGIFKQYQIGIGSVLHIKGCEVNDQRRILAASVITLAPVKALDKGNMVLEKYWGEQPSRISKNGGTKFCDELYEDQHFSEENFSSNSIDYSLISGLMDKSKTAKNVHYTIRTSDRLIPVDWHRFKELKIGDNMESTF
jgi:hypothetical protein